MNSAQTPELKRHLREIAEGNRRDREWMAVDRLEEVVGLCDLVASHAISASEGARRRDQALLGEHLRHARGALVLAIGVFKSLPFDAGEVGRPP